MEETIKESDFLALLDLTAKTGKPIKVLRAKREDGSLEEIYIKKKKVEHKIAENQGLKRASHSSYSIKDSGNILVSVGIISLQSNTFQHRDTKAYKRFSLIKVFYKNKWHTIIHGK